MRLFKLFMLIATEPSVLPMLLLVSVVHPKHLRPVGLAFCEWILRTYSTKSQYTKQVLKYELTITPNEINV